MMNGHALRSCVLAAGLLIGAVPAFAQDDSGVESAGVESAAFGARQARPVEVLLGVDGVTSWIGNGRDVRLSISAPKGERLSFEFFGGGYHDVGAQNQYDTDAIYGFQIKQRIMSRLRPGIEPFVTYGAMGIVGRQLCGKTPCRPAKPAQVVPPFLGLLGAGVQHAITPHLGLRIEAQGGFFAFIPVGLRLSAAVTVPFGHFAPEAIGR